MRTPDKFEAHMAQVIWDHRWKDHSAFDEWLENHMSADGAAVQRFPPTVPLFLISMEARTDAAWDNKG